MRRNAVTLGGVVMGLLLLVAHDLRSADAASWSATTEPTQEGQLVATVNADRAAAGLATLTIDPKLTAIARQRAAYQISHRFFSHCIGGGFACGPGGYQFVSMLRHAGFPSMWEGENLAVSNDQSVQLVQGMHDDWVQSAPHEAQIMNGQYNATGLGIVCCDTLTMSDGAAMGGFHVAVEIFARYPPNVLAAARRREAAASGGR